MVLRIEQTSSDPETVLTLAGRIGSDDVQALKTYTEHFERLTLDLDQVHLVNLDAVRFLAECETKGIELRNCRPHVRAWIYLEKPRIGDLD